MTSFGACISVQSNKKRCSADIRGPAMSFPCYKLLKCSETFWALIVVEALPFPRHQANRISSYGDRAQVFENPPSRIPSEQPNMNFMNAKRLEADGNAMGCPPNEWPVSLEAYPAAQCLASAIS